MRLIDADEMNVKQWFASPDNRKRMTEALAAAPTIDAEPVVRCMECENSEPCPIAGVDYIYCNKWESIANKNGYCYCGAKMDGDTP